MAVTENTYTGNGSTTLYSFTFPYLDEADIKVTLNGSPTTAYTLANATTISFTTPPANGDSIRIYRRTNTDKAKATFFPGSAIRAQDLNNNTTQSLYSVQEWQDQTVPKYEAVMPDDLSMGGHKITDLASPTSNQDAANKQYVDSSTWNVTTETIDSGETWVGSNSYVATTGAIDNRIDSKIDTALTNDVIGVDGVTVSDNTPGSGQITIGLGVGSVDVDRLKAEDIITITEQDSGTPNWVGDDSKLATAGALARRFDTIYQTGTPSGTNWQTGKLWYDHINDQTLSIWDGASQLWRPISSGGTFVEQPTVIWVDSLNGLDANNGHRIIDAMKTIKAAVASANPGDIVLVLPGVYQETLPIDITVSNLSIVGQSIRSCFVIPTPATAEQTMFRCNSGTYIGNFTFAGLKASGSRGGYSLDSDPTYGLPANQGWVAAFYPGSVIRKSPYIQNCTNFTDSSIDLVNFDPNNFQGTGGDVSSAPSGGGILVDGSVPNQTSPLRSFVVDSFTQICLDGPGVLCTNNGYAQLVSFFGTFCHYHAKAINGGQLNLSNCTTDFGRYGLIADGKSSSAIFTSTANGGASIGASTFTINATTPSIGWHGDQTNPRPVDNMLVEVSGNTYPIKSSSVSGAGWTITLADGFTLNSTVNNGATVNFYLRSLVSTGGHTFEYVGSGTDYNALPDFGGVADEAKQVVELNGGAVWQSSTDHNGKFKVGNVLVVDQNASTISYNGVQLAASATTDTTNASNITLGTLNSARLPNSGVVAGTYGTASNSASVTVDAKGRVTSASNTPIAISSGAVSGLAASATTDTTNASNISSGTLNQARLPLSGVTAGSYGSASTSASVTVDDKGRVTAASSNPIAISAGAVSGLAASATTDTTNATNISSGTLSATRLPASGVSAGSYTNSNVTVDSTGRITSISSGSSGGSGTVTNVSGTAPIQVVNGTTTPSVSISAATTAAAGSMSAADKLKLDGIASGATANTGTVTNVTGVAPIQVATGTSTPSVSISNATVSAAGAMSAADKTKLDGIATGATANTGTVTSVATGTGLTGGPITSSGTISLDNTAVTAGSYTTANITVDAQGRITAASNGAGGGATNIDGLSDGTTQFNENVGLGAAALSSLASGGQENTALGYTAGQNIATTSNNTLIGAHSAQYITGSNNTAVGRRSLVSVSGSSGSYNTCIGVESGSSITSGNYNVFFGAQTGLSCTTGANNVAIGPIAGYSTTTGSHQIAIGFYSGFGATADNIISIGEYTNFSPAGSSTANKIAIGKSALFSVTTGQSLIALGNTSGFSVTTGLRNTFVGHSTGYNTTTGTDNTFIGNQAGYSFVSGNNNVAIGKDAEPSSTTVSNEITLGNSSIATLRCNTQTISSLSDGRDKTEVEDLPLGLAFISTLRPVKFKWETRDGNGKDGTYDAGFIAQDLQLAQFKSQADYLNMVMDENPDRLEARYGQLIPVLVQAIKDLKTEIDTLKANA
jgi:hypothetical protein